MPAAPGFVRIDHTAEARAHDDGHVCREGEHLSGKLDSRHLGHGLVGNDEVEAGDAFFKKFKAFLDFKNFRSDLLNILRHLPVTLMPSMLPIRYQK